MTLPFGLMACGQAKIDAIIMPIMPLFTLGIALSVTETGVARRTPR